MLQSILFSQGICSLPYLCVVTSTLLFGGGFILQLHKTVSELEKTKEELKSTQKDLKNADKEILVRISFPSLQ